MQTTQGLGFRIVAGLRLLAFDDYIVYIICKFLPTTGPITAGEVAAVVANRPPSNCIPAMSAPPTQGRLTPQPKPTNPDWPKFLIYYFPTLTEFRSSISATVAASTPGRLAPQSKPPNPDRKSRLNISKP